MKRVILICISVLLHFLYAEPIGAQVQNMGELINGMNHFYKTQVSEKVYLHSDKNTYLAGEIAWFKVYNLAANNHLLSSLSSLVYVELLNIENEPVIQLKIPVKNGLGEGSIALPLDLKSGNYILRAYTHWMKNFNAQLFFQKSILILNTGMLPAESQVQLVDSFHIQLYPESGNILAGVENTIAFKTTDLSGKGIDAKGYLLNSQSDTLVHFSSQHQGIGKFHFTPTFKEAYTAVFINNNGKQLSTVLPDNFENGILIQLQQEDSLLTLHFPSNKNADAQYVFLAHTNNNINRDLSKEITKNERMTIHLSNLSEGIHIFTVLDKQFRPIAERLFFKYPSTALNLNFKLEKEFSKRAAVHINLALTNANGAPSSAYVSAAVYKYDSIIGIDSSSIQDYLLLTSNLTETIESPFRYFTAGKEDVQKWKEIDLLMMTHGWRKYNWNSMGSSTAVNPTYLPESSGHFIHGKVSLPSAQKLEDTAPVFLSTTGNFPSFKIAPIDAMGQFNFILPNFYNNGQIVLQRGLFNTLSKSLEFSIQDPFYSKPTKFTTKNLPFGSYPSYSLTKAHIQLEIQNNFESKSDKFMTPAIDTLSFYGKPNNKYLLDNYVRFNTLEEVLREYVSPVMLRKRNEQYFINVYDSESKNFFTSSPLVLIDGVPQLDFNSLLNMDPLKIKQLEVVDRTYYYGKNTFYGILHFTSYTGNNIEVDMDQQLKTYDYKGLEQQRIFETPKYNQEFQIRSRMPDFRTLLSWQPQLVINEQGKADVSFFTSDISGNYIISIQGVSKEGIPIQQLIPFKVK